MQEKISLLKQTLSNGVTPAMDTPLHEGSYTVNTAVIPLSLIF
ncbi:MAG: hypothetical protein M5U34_16460 [Chloroflexi bacterium]|nr:hypothetical protein [Chloroflexota bacterium]